MKTFFMIHVAWTYIKSFFHKGIVQLVIMDNFSLIKQILKNDAKYTGEILPYFYLALLKKPIKLLIMTAHLKS